MSSIGHHLGDDFALNGAVLEVLAVEVLRSVAHSVAGVADDWQLHFVFIGQSQGLYVRAGGEHTLLSLGQFIVVLVFYDILRVELGTQWVDVEEGVFSMVYLGGWLAVLALESLVAYGW